MARRRGSRSKALGRVNRPPSTRPKTPSLPKQVRLYIKRRTISFLHSKFSIPARKRILPASIRQPLAKKARQVSRRAVGLGPLANRRKVLQASRLSHYDVLEDVRTTCKARPSNKTRTRGTGARRAFIPWCDRKRR